MAKASPIQTSFNAGELSPKLEGRVDMAKYANGAKLIENFMLSVQGPAVRRAGTRFVNEVKSSANRTWLLRFEFNTTQAYVLEFGDGYIRFYANHGQVVVGAVHRTPRNSREVDDRPSFRRGEVGRTVRRGR